MNLIVTGALQASSGDLKALENLGFQITVHPDERAGVPHPERYDAAICNNLFGYHDIRLFSNLKYIQLTSAGLDRVPLEYIREAGIRICNAAGVYSVPMAEFALWGVLELYKQGRFFADNQRAHRWEKHRGLKELAGKRVCIVGCGSVGSACAQRFAAFGCRVTGIATSGREQTYFDAVLPMEQLPGILGEADILVLALPLTETTRRLFDKAMFARLKPGAVFVNLARGAIVDTDALIRALETTLSGAVIDVFESEPLGADAPLWEIPNLILTPHNSFVGEHNHQRMMDLTIRNLKQWRQP